MALFSFRPALAAVLCLAGAARAQVQCSRVVNAASYEAGLPEPGALAAVFCTGIATVSGIVVAPTFDPLPRQLSGVSILINGYYNAPILAVADQGGGAQQINFQVPIERLLAQKSTLQVLTQSASGTASNSPRIENLDYPHTGGFFFQADALAFAQHVADGSWVTAQNPVRAGEVIAILGTGFGGTYPPKPVAFTTPASPAFQGTMDFADPGTEYNISQPLRELTVGASVAKVTSIGLAAGYLGVDRIVFEVPPTSASGMLDLGLAAGSTSCSPFPSNQRCPFVASATSNRVKLPVR